MIVKAILHDFATPAARDIHFRCLLCIQTALLPLNQVVDAHIQMTQGLLLLSQLLLDPSHGLNQMLVLLILFVVLVIRDLTRVQFEELLLELNLNVKFIAIGLVEFLSVDLHDFKEFGSLLSLPDVNDYAHHHILHSLQSLRLLLICLVVTLVGYYVVDWYLVPSLGSLDVPVLSDEHSSGKTFMLAVLVYVICQLLVRVEHQLHFRLGSHIDIHDVLKEECSLVDDATSC